jgi:hypothetical protein
MPWNLYISSWSCQWKIDWSSSLNLQCTWKSPFWSPTRWRVRHQNAFHHTEGLRLYRNLPCGKMNMFGKFVIRGIIEFLFRHRLVLCLNEFFSLRFHYTINNRIKFGAKVNSSACLRTKDGMNLDYFIIYGILVYILSHYPHGSHCPHGFLNIIWLEVSIGHTELWRPHRK